MPDIGPFGAYVALLIVAGVVLTLVRVVSRWHRTGVGPAGVPESIYGEEVILRTYWAKDPAGAIRWYQRDLDVLVEHGYVPSSQCWVPGEWGFGAFLAALLLMPVVVGFVILMYVLIVKPAGVLTATYVLRELVTPITSSGPASL